MLSILQIQKVVADIYNVSLPQIVGARASRNVTEPRLIAMWICGEVLTDKSLSQIARAFKRDRTTITHGIRRGREITGSSLEHIEKVNRIIETLRERAKIYYPKEMVTNYVASLKIR